MLKSQAIALFGGAPQLAEALGVTRQRVYQMPKRLRPFEVDRVVGAALRLGKIEKAADVAKIGRPA